MLASWKITNITNVISRVLEHNRYTVTWNKEWQNKLSAAAQSKATIPSPDLLSLAKKSGVKVGEHKN
jgi:hypothetical protein